MNKSKYVFAQLTAFLNRNHFNYLVRKYDGDKYVKHFTCWNQLLTMMFGQLSNRESLRDLIIAIEAHYHKCYHLGLGRHITRSNLAKANSNRDYRIFEEYAYYLVSEARRKRAVLSSISNGRRRRSSRRSRSSDGAITRISIPHGVRIVTSTCLDNSSIRRSWVSMTWMSIMESCSGIRR